MHRAEGQSGRAGARERSSVKRAALPDAPPQKPFLGKRFPVLFFPKAAEHFSRLCELVGRQATCASNAEQMNVYSPSARRFVAITP